MKNLHIIMPMAGEGRRFKDAGYDIPKPLLKPNDGQELFFCALNSLFAIDDLPFSSTDVYDAPVKMTFIVRTEFISDYHIDNIIKSVYPTANVIGIDKTTRGALETVMLAEPFIDKENDAVLVMDCDFCFHCESYIRRISHELLTEDPHPLLMSFYSKFPGYSYAETENNGGIYYAVNVVEKHPISTHAIAGCYFLGSANRFLKCAKKVIKDWENGKIDSKEIYLSLVYNYLLKDLKYRDSIELIDMNLHKDHLWSFNTPQDFENRDIDKNIWDN